MVDEVCHDGGRQGKQATAKFLCTLKDYFEAGEQLGAVSLLESRNNIWRFIEQSMLE